ncbi:hypothetical protein [Methanosarcina sp. WH1]|uniref:hypothetical protein n=1 Tax=Methanosarcina sp. WH1 TaxID=1434102 RepID=UPI00350F7468
MKDLQIHGCDRAHRNVPGDACESENGRVCERGSGGKDAILKIYRVYGFTHETPQK